ncbi:hypothetical protein [Cellulophaga baltica]|uniref:hypothetical protein n=1 Tax=Cellulophaga baltica TaxID=76594 RepID=UPI0024956D60|nr:hypothetical protein [Cellulophaga baltica]
MAKKTSTTTRKGRATRSSGGVSTTKGNPSRSSGRATTKGGQSYNEEYDNDSYSSGSTKGGSVSSDDYGGSYSSAGSTSSNTKPSGGNAGSYSSGSSTKEGVSYNDNDNSGDSYNSGNTKESSRYSDSYNDSGSSAKEDSSYNDDGGEYSNDEYEGGVSTKGDNAYDDNYSNDDSYNSGNGKDTGGYSNNEPINDPPPYEDYNDEVVAKTSNTGESSSTSKYSNNEGEADMTFTEEEVYNDEVVAKTPNTGGSGSTSKYGNNEGEADMTFTEEEAFGEERERSGNQNQGSRSSTIRRVWVWAGGAVPSRHIGNPQAAWWRNRFELGMTDYVIALNDHDFSNGLGIRSHYLDQGNSSNRWAPICEILRTINEANIAPHLMIFFPPHPGLIREAAEALNAILENSQVMPRSIQFDLEGWWTRRSDRERSVGEHAIQEHFIDGWRGRRPELGFGITSIGSVPSELNRALRKVDFAIPQMYASERNYGRPIQENSVRRHFARAAEALGENGKVIAGQTAYSNYVNPQVMKDMLEVLLRQHSNGIRVNEIAYWSDIHLMNSSRNRQFFQRLTNLVRLEGLNLDNINSL